MMSAQSDIFSLENEAPYFTRYTMEQGLADNWVHVAMRDSHGFLWFGTEGGLSRFDGTNFLNFNEQKDNPAALSSNSVIDMCEDPDGTFWLAVLDGGLNHFDPATGKFESWKTDPIHPEWGTDPLSIISVCQDGDLLWLGSYHHGLGCFDKKKRQYVGWWAFREDNLSERTFEYNSAKQVIADRWNPDILWVAAGNRGLAKFDKRTGSFDITPIEDNFSNAGVAALKLVQDENGKIWIATWSAGVASFDPETRQLKKFPYNIPLWKKGDANRNVVSAIIEKNAGELWVATQDQGFGVFNKNSGEYHFVENRLSGESIERDRNCDGLYLDPEQRLWVLGYQGGVRSYYPKSQSFQYISLASGNGTLEHDQVTAFSHKPGQKSIFIATANSGCYEMSLDLAQLKQLAKPIPGGLFPDFRALLVDSKGNVWAGAKETLGGQSSLYFLRPGKAFFEPFILPLKNPSPLEKSVNDIFEDLKGNIWIATSYFGIYKISPDRKVAKHYSADEGFEKEMRFFHQWWFFTKMQEDQRGHIWLALKNGGLLDFDPDTEQFVQYDEGNLLPSKNVNALEIGDDGSVWIGANNRGLLHIEYGKGGVPYLENSGRNSLAGTIISKIEKDGKGNLWLATNRGLVHYDVGKKSFKILGRNEGLKVPYLTEKGLAFFLDLGVLVGQPNGFCILQSLDDPSNSFVPTKVVLTDFKVFNKSYFYEKKIRNAKEVVLKPSEGVFSFEFAAPAALNPEMLAFEFMLDGLDGNWYSAYDRKSISYSGLSPGTYTFRVRASIVGEAGTSPETTLRIRILPDWWQTWWFIASLVLASILVVWAVIRYRTSQIRHEEKLKTEFYKKLSETEMRALRAQMNPHFIFNCLNSINHFVVRNDSQEAAKYISKFSRLIRLVLDNSSAQKVSLEKELEALRLYMDLEVMRFAGKFRYELWVDDHVDAQFTQVQPMLIQPFVENAIWHGLMHRPEGGSVVVDVQHPSEHLLIVEIIDDGVGRARAAELESKTSLQHKPQGTSITADRLHMSNPDNPNSGKVTIHDLLDAEGLPSGTKVVLEIPV